MSLDDVPTEAEQAEAKAYQKRRQAELDAAGWYAFPIPGPLGLPGNPGMTLRDYFAAKAAAAFIVAQGHGWGDSATDAARWAYQIADAMLEARKLKGDGQAVTS